MSAAKAIAIRYGIENGNVLLSASKCIGSCEMAILLMARICFENGIKLFHSFVFQQSQMNLLGCSKLDAFSRKFRAKANPSRSTFFRTLLEAHAKYPDEIWFPFELVWIRKSFNPFPSADIPVTIFSFRFSRFRIIQSIFDRNEWEFCQKSKFRSDIFKPLTAPCRLVLSRKYECNRQTKHTYWRVPTAGY